ncbi:hypothetical protein [Streptomyces hoynatensis]|uniref:Uncharacterized protein n=1 Tax=Streptomyces hoynatensis TaxID=1141874 RepID=A0A3A9YPF8_9ACTN|nr:hypothetical protein [Streptomyces hoynatensis]RKN38021.1 hypothetical protein D7294_25885 [Streptomyces hoynatensis]
MDYVYGSSAPGTGWCYLHPGPADSWAGRRAHTFTLRFLPDEAPAADLGFAPWLTDTHAPLPGTADLALNGTLVETLAFAGGATKGSLAGYPTAPGSPLKPSFHELPLPAAAFIASENVLTPAETRGSRHAHDAIGVFAPAG